MNQISPTPWTVRSIELHEGGTGVEITDAEGNSVACNQTYYPTALKPENADIMAAAPDLLEALEEFLDDYLKSANSGDWGNWDVEGDSIIIKVRAAIKKAKG